MKKLKYLNLKNNQMRELEAADPAAMPNLETLDMASNLLSCDSGEEFQREFVATLTKLSQLKILDVSQNPVTAAVDVGAVLVPKMPNLVQINGQDAEEFRQADAAQVDSQIEAGGEDDAESKSFTTSSSEEEESVAAGEDLQQNRELERRRTARRKQALGDPLPTLE